MKNNQAVTVNGIKYEVIGRVTAADHLAAGRPNVAKFDAEAKRETLHLKRENGNTLYVAYEYQTNYGPMVTKPISMGRMESR